MDWNRMYITSGILGAFFGLALEKGRVLDPTVIFDQMLMQRFVMLKMFMSAVSTSLLCMSILSLLKMGDPSVVRRTEKQSALEVVVGTFLLGCGMSFAGSCPGTVMAQLGAGVFPSAIFVLLGGLTGAFVFTRTSTIVETQLRKPIPYLENEFLDRKLNVPYHFVALGLSGFMFLFVLTLEYFVPWYSEYSGAEPLASWIPSPFAAAWPPEYAGIIIGLIQLPAILLIQKMVGSSTSYVVVTSTLQCAFMPDASNVCINKYGAKTESNYWQVVFLGGAVMGAFLSSVFSWSFYSISGFSWWLSFIGGFLVIYGARIANGCTSGHGISGFSRLWIPSLVAVPSMFGGAILTAIILRMIGLH